MAKAFYVKKLIQGSMDLEWALRNFFKGLSTPEIYLGGIPGLPWEIGPPSLSGNQAHIRDAQRFSNVLSNPACQIL